MMSHVSPIGVCRLECLPGQLTHENKLMMHDKVLGEPLLHLHMPRQLPWYALICSHLWSYLCLLAEVVVEVKSEPQ